MMCARSQAGSEIASNVLREIDCRSVSLRVEIDQQRLPTTHGQRGGEVNGRRGFADPALLVGDCDNHATSAGDTRSARRRAALELS